MQFTHRLEEIFMLTLPLRVNNNERWVGPNQHGQPDELYTTLVNVVETYRKKQQAQMQMLE